MSGPGLQGTNTKLELFENIPVWQNKIKLFEGSVFTAVKTDTDFYIYIYSAS